MAGSSHRLTLSQRDLVIRRDQPGTSGVLLSEIAFNQLLAFLLHAQPPCPITKPPFSVAAWWLALALVSAALCTAPNRLLGVKVPPQETHLAPGENQRPAGGFFKAHPVVNARGVPCNHQFVASPLRAPL